jgi:hypothetical protein
VPPPSVWPPLPPDASNKPIELPPLVPSGPGVWPPRPIFAPGPGGGDTLPVEPGTIWPPLPPEVPPGKVLALVGISGLGWRWAVLTVPTPK